ncbi:twin-arginine translocation signal domain-containing protein [Haladaptatus sp. NG-WS-4]
MRRRRFLTASGAAFAGGALAGCTGSGPEDSGNGDRTTTKQTTGADGTTTENDSGSGGTTSEEGGFTLVSSNVPKQVTMGEEFTLELTIENRGSSPAAFESAIRVEGSGGSSQQSGSIQTNEIAPGKTTTWKTNLSYPYVGQVAYRIEALDKTFTVDVVGERLSVGETYLSPTEVAVTVRNVTLTDRYQYVRESGRKVDVTASNGRQWAFVTLRAENQFRMGQALPKRDSFHLLVGDRAQAPTEIAKKNGQYKLEQFGKRKVEPGGSNSGWIAYEISADRSASDLAVEWKGNDGTGSWTAQWRP